MNRVDGGDIGSATCIMNESGVIRTWSTLLIDVCTTTCTDALFPPELAVMFEVPVVFAVTTPVVLTVATFVLLLVQVTVRLVRMEPPRSRTVAVYVALSLTARVRMTLGLSVIDATAAGA